MSKEVDVKESASVETVLERIKELQETRNLIENKKSELSIHLKDLNAITTINGENSNEWKVKKSIVDGVNDDIQKLEDKLSELSFKRSELKGVLDEVSKKFEISIREEQEREYHIELGTVDEETGKTNGKKIFKELLEYIQHDVEWTAKSAPGIMLLDTNMQENKSWVQNKDFDGVITLRSANILVLWRSILEEMHGKGSFAAKKFLTCWANCGKAITDAVRDIQNNHEETRILGTNLNIIEEEFERSIDDIPTDSKEVTTKDEVDPEV